MSNISYKMWLKTISTYLNSLFGHGNGAPAVASVIIGGITVGGIQLSGHLQQAADAISIKDFSYILLIEGGFFMFYVLFTFVNLASGLQAAKWEHKKCGKEKSYIEVDKLWKTIWKSLGMIFLTLMISFLSIMLSYMGFSTLYWCGVWFLVAFWLLANSYEFYSIGTNLERRHGCKPMLFKFWDKVIDMLEKKIISKINDSSFSEKQIDNCKEQQYDTDIKKL